MKLPTRAELQADAREDLALAVKLCDPKYQVGRVHRFICDLLGRVARGEIRRLILNMPPQHGKSRLCSIEFPAWLLGRDPTWKIVAASYAQDLANRNSRQARNRLTTPEYQWLFDTRLDPNHQSVAEWGVIGEGEYRAAGINAGITGRPADLLIIDDPVKDRASAQSALTRDAIWDWFVSSAYTRLSPRGSIIIIMTRWHVDDLVGRLLDPKRQEELAAVAGGKEDWLRINLPGLAKENDPMGRKPGEALYPERYSAADIRAKMALVGSYEASALYDGEPTVKGGGLVDLDWWNIVPAAAVPNGLRWMRFWDLGATKKQELERNDPDFSAGIKGALDEKGNLYLDGLVQGQWLWPKTRETIKNIAVAERILVGIETVAGFKVAYQNLREHLPPDIRCIECEVATDKLTRALPWSALAEARKVYLVKAEWNLALMTQAALFPQSPHDDLVDAVSGVYAMLTRGRRILVA